MSKPPICGENPCMPAAEAGCGEPIVEWEQVYRCTDCDTPFHKGCARRHFERSKTAEGAR